MKILLTGCTGFLGSHILYHLCKLNSYEVFCLVRSHTDINLFNKFPNIFPVRFIIADILDINKYKHVIYNCQMIIHTASPSITSTLLDENEENSKLIKPSINFVKILLENINTQIFQRFIFTSTVASGFNKENISLEKHWNLNSENPFIKSKVFAELEAFKIAKNNFSVVCINSGALFGANILSKPSKNFKHIKQIITNPDYPFCLNYTLPFVDVDDVALFHIMALNNPRIPSGRFIFVNKNIELKEINNTYSKFNKNIKQPMLYILKKTTRFLIDNHINQYNQQYSFDNNKYKINNSKSKKSNKFITYTNVETTLEKIHKCISNFNQ